MCGIDIAHGGTRLTLQRAKLKFELAAWYKPLPVGAMLLHAIAHVLGVHVLSRCYYHTTTNDYAANNTVLRCCEIFCYQPCCS